MNELAKYKGKKIDSDEWVYGQLFQSFVFGKYQAYINSNLVLEMRKKQFIDVIPETVCQFTGLKDMNGKDSFDGDLIKNIEFKEKFIQDNIYKVFWHKGRGQWMCSSNNRTRKLSAVINNGLIVGSIHDKS